MHKPSVESWDIVISGGGIAGLITAAAFGAQGASVLCVDPTAPVLQENTVGADLRSTAFLAPSVTLLEKIGLWSSLAPHGAPLKIMRIVDAGGKDTTPRLIRDFDCADIQAPFFAWNVPNWILRREIAARLAELPNVAFHPNVATQQIVTREDQARITLSDGRHIAARLLIGADGRDSHVRQALGIGVRQWRYGQKALVFAVSHDQPHEYISTEIHRSGGPFTLVPLPDRDGQPASAVVWMDSGRETHRLAALSSVAFEDELTLRSAGVLGRLRLITARSQWPIISQIADRFSGMRTALIAEAAHVVPPIGAQGLNMSLADLAMLLELSQNDPGNAASLTHYDRSRRREAMVRVLGIDALNRASQASLRPLRDLRAAALGGLYAMGPVRQMMMRAGLGL